MSTSAALTPSRSWITLQPSRASSVRGSVVRRRLRVMLTTTTLEDIATERPTIAAPARLIPKAQNTTPAMAHVTTT